MSSPIYTFGLYLIVVLIIGMVAYKMTNTFSDYVLGGRKLGSWVTAISAQASDMSGWLLLGLPGVAFTFGMGSIWIVIGLAIGTLINWLLIAKRLRRYTELLDALTLPDYFEARFKDSSRILRVISAFLILTFFLFYTASGLVSGGKLFQSAFGFEYTIAVILGAVVIIGYTLLGGFLAVCWTDLIQGLLMVGALVIVPIVTLQKVGGVNEVLTTIGMVKPNLLSTLAGETTFSGIFTLVVGSIAWGLGYFGQPHILIRFMGISSAKHLPKSTLIASVWMLLCLCGAISVGLFGFVAVQKGLATIDDPEKVFMALSSLFFHPLVAGLLLAAIMAAIMSSVDSFLMVTSSSLAEDFYKQLFRKNATERELLLITRLCVLLISVAAIFLALKGGSVLGLIAYAWGGLGAAFGPVIVMSLYWQRMTKWGAVAGMLTGAATIVIWQNVPLLAGLLYELVPAFIFGILAIVVVSLLTDPPSEEIKEEFAKAQKPLYNECDFYQTIT